MPSVNSQSSVPGAAAQQSPNANAPTIRAGHPAPSVSERSGTGVELSEEHTVFEEALESSRDHQTMPTAFSTEPDKLKGDTPSAYPQDQKAVALQYGNEKFDLADAIVNTMTAFGKNKPT